MPHATRPGYKRALSSFSQKDKPRLYVALYPRGGCSPSLTSSASCDSYHWCLIIGPQTSARKDPGVRYHVAHTSGSILDERRRASVSDHAFIFEEDDILTTPTAQAVLVRVTVAKVLDEARVQQVLRSIPLPAPQDHSYTCLSWVREAFTALHADGCLKSYLDEDDWMAVEERARKYCRWKRHTRRFTDAVGAWDPSTVSTWNFWENRETNP